MLGVGELKGGSGRNKKGIRNGGSEERKPGKMWIEIRTEDDVRVRERMKPKSGLETIQNFHLMFSQGLTKGSAGHSTPQCPWQYRGGWKSSYCLQIARGDANTPQPLPPRCSRPISC